MSDGENEARKEIVPRWMVRIRQSTGYYIIKSARDLSGKVTSE